MCPAYGVKRNGNAPQTEGANRAPKELCEDCGNGSKHECADIVGLASRCAGFVYWLSRYVTGNNEDAEDVLQKTFLAVESRFPEFGKNESVAMRLARIAVEESFARLRGRDASKWLRLNLEANVNGVVEPQSVAAWNDDMERRYSREELRRIVHEGVEGLTPFSRVVLLLRDVARLEPEEIADLFRLSVPCVKSHLLRSRLQLREQLNKYFKSTLKEKAQTA